MLADVGTRRGATISDIDNNSKWFNGLPFMTLDLSEMSIKSVSDIKMTMLKGNKSRTHEDNRRCFSFDE